MEPTSDLATMLPYPALSPDGRHLAFVAPFQSQNSVWVQTLGSLDARPLTGTGQAAFPFWSPDGRFVAFGGGGRLKRISTAGGGAPQGPRHDGWRLLWRRLEPQRNDRLLRRGGLFRVSSAGGEKARLTRIDATRGETAHRFPVLLA